MSDCVRRLRAAVLVRLSEAVGFFSMALACVLLAGCAGGTPPPLTADQTSPPRVEPATARAATAQPGTWANAAVTADPAVLQRRRQIIAENVEVSSAYRTIVWVQLINAKLAGPFEWGGRTIYCASAQLWSAIGTVRTTVIRVERSSDGSERLTGATGGLFECTNANYGPFPELEEARAKRRKRLGLD
jgi:hypothetical protein